MSMRSCTAKPRPPHVPPKMASAPASKRRRVEEEEGEREGEVLATSLQRLSKAISKAVDETKAGFESARSEEPNFERFLTVGGTSGIRNLWSHVASYAECMRANGVGTYSELERLGKTRQQVREALGDLLEAERRHEDLLKEMEGVFAKLQNGGEPIVEKKVGDDFCGEIKVVDARSQEVREVRSYWEGSKFTLFMLIRHFG